MVAAVNAAAAAAAAGEGNRGEESCLKAVAADLKGDNGEHYVGYRSSMLPGSFVKDVDHFRWVWDPDDLKFRPLAAVGKIDCSCTLQRT